MPPNTPPVLIVPVAGALLTHVPPAVALLNVVVCPTQVVSVPVMAAGSAFTVAVTVIEQLLGSVYTMFVVPAEIPPRTPLPMPIVPVAGVLLDHVPPVGVPVRLLVLPSHTCSEPLTPVGNALTSTTMVREQPVGKV